jgi:hypothetical protein
MAQANREGFRLRFGKAASRISCRGTSWPRERRSDAAGLDPPDREGRGSLKNIFAAMISLDGWLRLGGR